MRAASTLSVFVLASSLLACSQKNSADNSAADLLDVPLPYTVKGDELGVWNGKDYTPVFIKGVNLGVAVPGTLAGELAATRTQYDRWFEQIGSLGFNAIRVYTLHYPRFYEAIDEYNRKHSDAPLYVLHGIWLDEDNPNQNFYDMTDGFDAGIKEVVDCAHGHRTIAERKGRAFGEYKTDMSRWIMGWVIGREMIPDEVAGTNAANPDRTSFQGDAISLDHGNPLEAWLAERLNGLVLYERAHYKVDRPVSVSSWPTLDPLTHPSEPANSTEDEESLDLENIDTTHAPGGYFASYHAYPYYPDFMTRDEAYQSATDREGQNSYLGYLDDLKAHYATHPLLIAEFGIPTSWGNAHFGAAGMNHGGQDEVEQGDQAGRLLTNTFDAHCAGGAFFAWIDEWWKRTWIVDELSFPREHYPFWHNVTSPEDNFGLIAFDVGQPKFTRWPKVTGKGRIREVDADYDVEYFYVRVKLDAALADMETLVLGYDTYGDDVGESVLPGGTTTTRRNEFALTFTAPTSAKLSVMHAYDLFGIWHKSSTPDQLYHSIASDSGDWVTVRWRNNSSTTSADAGDDVDEIGELQVKPDHATASSRDAIFIDGTTIQVRMPWTLLQFTDPTTRSVMNDDRSTPDVRETTVSDGIGLSVQLGSDLVETGRFRWQTWSAAPPTTERLKASAAIFSETVRALR